MRSSLIVAASLVIMLIGMVGTALILFDEERVKGLLVAQVERNTGRRVEILGSVKLRLFPGLQVQANRIILRDRDDDTAPAFLSAERVQLQLQLLPLIRGQAVADEVRLSGTQLNLDVASDGLDRARAEPGEEARAQLGFSTGNIILDDLSVDIYDASTDFRQSFAVEQVKLSGFALDRPVAFRFSGNIGEPALFDQLDVHGRLIARSSGQFQLDDMRLVGSLEQGRYALEVRGDLAFQAGSRGAFSLGGGQLSLNQYQFEVDLAYQTGERPYLSAVVSGQLIDVDSFILLDQLAMLPHEPSRSALLAAIAGFDFDVRLDLAQVGRFGLVIHDLSTAIRGEQGRLSLNGFSAALPGGFVGGQAMLDLGVSARRWQLQADIELADSGHLFSLLWPETELTGAGRLTLDLESLGRIQGSTDLPWAGDGQLTLWDGRFGIVSFLKDASGEQAVGDGSFASLESVWRLGPRDLEWQALDMVGVGWIASGELTLSGRDGGLLGNLQMSDELGTVRFFELGGRLAQPELLAPPIVLATYP